MSNKFHFWRAVDAAERTAKMFGRLLVPSAMLHWERKLRLADRRIQIGKQAFFALSQDEMTPIEFKKYSEVAYDQAMA